MRHPNSPTNRKLAASATRFAREGSLKPRDATRYATLFHQEDEAERRRRNRERANAERADFLRREAAERFAELRFKCTERWAEERRAEERWTELALCMGSRSCPVLPVQPAPVPSLARRALSLAASALPVALAFFAR